MFLSICGSVNVHPLPSVDDKLDMPVFSRSITVAGSACLDRRSSTHLQAATKAATGAATSKTGNRGATIPQSERLCKVLPKVMQTAIKGVRDLDEQVTTYFFAGKYGLCVQQLVFHVWHVTAPVGRLHRGSVALQSM